MPRSRASIGTYFAVVTAVILAATLALFGTLYRHFALQDLVNMAEDYNIALARSLSNTVWDRHSDYLTSVSEYDPRTLADRPETQALDDLMHMLVRGLPILRIKLYSPSGLTVYSSEHTQIGEDHIRLEESVGDGEGLARAVAERLSVSKLSSKDRFSAFSGEMFNKDVIETYVPIEDASGEIISVFEIYSDVTATKSKIDHAIGVLLLGVALKFLILYLLLVFFVMRRALAPLRAASEQAAAIDQRTSGARLPLAGMPREVLPLIEAINGALERLDRALDAQRQFTADAAHELLTPLAVLSAHVDAIEDRTVAAELRGDVEAMSDLVTQLLELAELESPDAVVDERTCVRDACHDVISMLAPVAYKQGKSISLTGAADAIEVRCGARMLVRALRNLVENAIVHTPPGTEVEVNVGSDGAIHVIDNGPGVPAGERDLIFRRFWRGTKRNRPGAGLGLAIAQRFAEAHNGIIEVGDAPGGGAVFTLRLPVAAKG